MTAIDLNDLAAVPKTQASATLLHRLCNWLAARRQLRNERLTRLELSRLDARLLRDMGINPADVRDAYEGRHSSVLFQPLHPADGE